MATHTYSDANPDVMTYEAVGRTQPRGGYDVGGRIFLWIAWAAAFGFWALTMSSFFGILGAISHPAGQGPVGDVDAGGVGWLLMEVVGVVVLAAGMAWGAMRWATRDKRLDATTEASTAALYDSVERAGGDDMVSRSPNARRPEERDSYRPA
ncbi:hypothetical protein [Phenylobacterium soli]|uniref:Uncharacterized protein n=1 Tax=Phenylobacterium soli TaxID=2170551 RepID=A0A328APX9_9CAUL|nr:hypothetical protein [Phenylobacterium soli]RAK55806.1 hypothetical protein DJ017_15450 [Phenylobacterium soli]